MPMRQNVRRTFDGKGRCKGHSSPLDVDSTSTQPNAGPGKVLPLLYKRMKRASVVR
jgi:hypothetical protein